MRYSDFIHAGFYYNHGQELVREDSIMQGPDYKYYRVLHVVESDEVYLEEAQTHALIEPTQEFLHDSTIPDETELAHIPDFQ